MNRAARRQKHLPPRLTPSWHADLIGVATQGMVLQALLKAEAQVRGILAAIPKA